MQFIHAADHACNAEKAEGRCCTHVDLHSSRAVALAIVCTVQLRNLDPFLMLDEFDSGKPAGFPGEHLYSCSVLWSYNEYAAKSQHIHVALQHAM
jgi:hypothetical protein